MRVLTAPVLDTGTLLTLAACSDYKNQGSKHLLLGRFACKANAVGSGSDVAVR